MAFQPSGTFGGGGPPGGAKSAMVWSGFELYSRLCDKWLLVKLGCRVVEKIDQSADGSVLGVYCSRSAAHNMSLEKSWKRRQEVKRGQRLLCWKH